MGMMKEVLMHPEDLYVLVKMKMAAAQVEKQIPPDPHWAFCYTMLQKVSRSFAFVIQQLGTDLRNAVCVFYLVLRALDTVEDDTSIPEDIKVPILESFHRHIYNPDWHFSCGTKDYKVLMDNFRNISTAFLELGKSYQEGIEDITERMGRGMAKFICKEIMAIGTLALCYNNGEIFTRVVKMRRGVVARVMDQTRTMSDVYGAFFKFSSLLKSKIDNNDPNANLTRTRIEAIQNSCVKSGMLNKRGCHVYSSSPAYNSVYVILALLLVSILFAVLAAK